MGGTRPPFFCRFCCPPRRGGQQNRQESAAETNQRIAHRTNRGMNRVSKSLVGLALLVSLPAVAVECPGNTEDKRFRVYIFSQYFYGVTCAAAGAAVPEMYGKTVNVTNPEGSTCGNVHVYTSASLNFSQSGFIYKATTTYNAGCGCPEGSDTIVNGSGQPQWCSSPQPDPLDDLSNCINSWSVMQGDCGTFPEDCAAAGGTFGFYGEGAEMQPVCLPGQGDPDAPECGVDLICNTPVQSTSVGSVNSIDDPAAPQAPTADTSNQTAAGAGSIPGTDSVTGEPCNAAAGGTCVANDTNGDGVCDPATEPNCKTKAEGAKGECDPESSDYASCAGLLEVDPGMVEYGKTAMDAARDNAVTKWEQTAGAALADNGVGTDPGGLADAVKAIFPTNLTCSDLVMQWQGEELRITCAGTQVLRDVLGWALYAIGAITIFGIFTRKPEE